MAAQVSPLVQLLSAYKEEQHRTLPNDSQSTALVTRDLLGGSLLLSQSPDVDLDLQVPNGWEKKLDLKSGKVYIQRCQSSNSESKHHTNPTLLSDVQDLNFPPSRSKLTLNLFCETSLDLKLVSSSSSASSSSSNNYASVCTLDKVKSALERAEKEPILKKRPSVWKSSSSPSHASSSSLIKEFREEESEEKQESSPIAAGCPGCLSYVLVMKDNPRCPRCHSVVPLPGVKKPRIDLNMSI